MTDAQVLRKCHRVDVKPSHDVHAIIEARVAFQPYLASGLRMHSPGEVEDVPGAVDPRGLNAPDELAVEPDGPARELMTLQPTHRRKALNGNPGVHEGKLRPIRESNKCSILTIMVQVAVEHDATLWMVNDVPTRMFYAGQRWRVTDTPTPLREPGWSAPLVQTPERHGWRFQATDPTGDTFVFDVYRSGDAWHVHHAYA